MKLDYHPFQSYLGNFELSASHLKMSRSSPRLLKGVHPIHKRPVLFPARLNLSNEIFLYGREITTNTIAGT